MAKDQVFLNAFLEGTLIEKHSKSIGFMKNQDLFTSCHLLWSQAKAGQINLARKGGPEPE